MDSYEPDNVISIKRKPKPKDLTWKVKYKIKDPKKDYSELKAKVIHWTKFVVFLALVAYAMSQCGYA